MRPSLIAFAASVAVLTGTLSHTSARSSAPDGGVNDAAILEGIPRALSEFRFFTAPREQIGKQLLAYELNTPLYSDAADKLRFIYLPDGSAMEADGEGLLQFPVGAAIIKTFAFGEGDDRRLIETRVLLHRADGWLALPYKWNTEQTDARLALAGARMPITRPDGSEISYRVPNKNQCKTCHSKDGEVIPIGPKARNLSAEWLAAAVANNDMAALPAGQVTHLPDWETRAVGDTEKLARAYLDVNCAHCHQPGGSASNSGLDLRWDQGDPHAIGIRKPPVAAGRGSGG
ncbi:MAG: hypothetical protein AAGE86_14650, partial [Pseudomonadota bacterium]